MSDAPRLRRPSVRRWFDRLFLAALGLVGGSYVLLIVLLVVVNACYPSLYDYAAALEKQEIRYSLWLTLTSCTLAAIFSVWVAVPLGYLLSRLRFPGRWLIDAVLDIPIVLPPLVIGLSLLILFHFRVSPGAPTLEELLSGIGLPVTFEIPSVILAQFTVACAFATRTMRVAYDQIDPRAEAVARTLGCSQAQAFWLVVLPQAWRGMIAALTIAWARSLGEFGPILVFSGATRMKTEVLSTTIFLELSVGSLRAAVAVSMIMVLVALGVLVVVRALGAYHRAG